MYYVQCSPWPGGRPCCVWCRIMFWACFVNTGIYLYTLRGRTLAWPGAPLSALYVLHVRVLVTRGRHRAVATEVPVTVPLHAWSGQGQPLVTGPSLVTISSQLVRDPIVIITRSPAITSSMAKKAGGRTHITHMRAFEKLESRV